MPKVIHCNNHNNNNNNNNDQNKTCGSAAAAAAEGGKEARVTRAARVMLRSFITSSNAAVSSACFWLCKAIFSLNFRGLFEVAMFRSPAPFFPSVVSVKSPAVRKRHFRVVRWLETTHPRRRFPSHRFTSHRFTIVCKRHINQ